MNVASERAGQPGDPCVMVIFGASGDLTKRKLIPALYNLAKDDLLSKEFAVVGLARREMSTEDFREKISQDIKEFATGPVDPDLWAAVCPAALLSAGRCSGRGHVPTASGLVNKSRQRARHARKLLLLPRNGSGFFLPSHSAIGGRRSCPGKQ